MNKFSTSCCLTLFRAVLLGLLMSVSWAGMAQDTSTGKTENPAVEVEQVDINHADATAIARILVGVGESRAREIVEYRNTYGDFTSMEDLLMVKGIGEATLRNNAARIRFD